MIDTYDQDRLALRRWAVEQATLGPAGRVETHDVIAAAQAIEAYVLADFRPGHSDVEAPADSGDAAAVEGQNLGLGHALGWPARVDFSGSRQAVPEKGVGDGFGAIAGNGAIHDEVSVGCDDATVGEGAGAVMAPAPSAPKSSP